MSIATGTSMPDTAPSAPLAEQESPRSEQTMSSLDQVPLVYGDSYQKFPKLANFESNPWQATVEHYFATLFSGIDTFRELLITIGILFGIDAAQVQASQIGFSDRSLGNQLPSNAVLPGKAIRTKLEELGIYKPNGRETLRGFVTIPLLDPQNEVTGIHAIRISRSGKIQDGIVLGSGALALPLRERLERLTVIQPVVTPPIVPSPPLALALTAPVVLTEDEHSTPEPSTPEPLKLKPPKLESPNPEPPKSDVELVIEPHHVTFIRGDRYYRVQGLDKNMSSLTLRVCIRASRFDYVHLDTLDLVKARSRSSFIQATAIELFVDEEIVKKDIGKLLLKLEDLRNRQIEAAKSAERPVVTLSEVEYEQALQWLKAPNLTDRIAQDLEQCGMVGEVFNKLVAYLAVISRKLPQPLAILVQSSSSAGKSTLMDSVLAMVPAEDQLRLSNMTGQSLYYLDSNAIRHRTLAISEDEGISEAAYALKLLQSEGRLCHATVAKSPEGRMTMQTYQVEGPVQLFLTSTGVEIDEELVNRCLVLTVDESREQTQAIQQRQRLLQTRSGQDAVRHTVALKKLHQNAQRLLKPLRVYNPYADQLSFASDRTRLRRDHGKYLTMIQSIALLHQYQRPTQWDESDGTRVESIEVLPSDIELANRLMSEILGRSLDELSPQTRRCLMMLETFVSEACQKQAIERDQFRFSRREFRESIRWSDFQVRMHFAKLVEMEYLLVHRGKQGRSFVYELLWGNTAIEA